MMASFPPEFCPYKGLQPYTEDDRAYFFGRERDQEIIASNLYAASLTVLYGVSGVGKTSVLMAGAVPRLRELPRLALVVFREWQNPDFFRCLKSEVLKAINPPGAEEINVDLGLDFDEFLEQCTRRFRGHIFFILDQFEEYFLYHVAAPTTDKFEAGLASSINRQDLPANFLLSMRDDGLSQLDRFQGRIPHLLSNILRLEHLDLEAAESAIRKPLVEYNRNLSDGQAAMDIEESLVESLLLDLQEGKVTHDSAGKGHVNSESLKNRAAARIETPFLQIVLMRLWKTERAEGSQILRLKTYEHLGRAEKIVRTHLDEVMRADELKGLLDTAADIFHFLVTPTGMKIAHTASDLASYTERSSEQVNTILGFLSSVRILRVVTPSPGQPDVQRYEIYHDVLAPAVLDWRARYLQKRKQAEAQTQAASIANKIKSKFIEQPASVVGVVSLTANILDLRGTSKTIWRWDNYQIVKPDITRDIIRGELWFSSTSKILKEPTFKYFFPRPVEIKILELGGYRCKYQVEIGGLLNYGESLSYEIGIEVLGAFFMSKEEHAEYLEKTARQFNKEYWGYSILIPVERLELNITFPEGYEVEAFPGACIGDLVTEDLLYDDEIKRIQQQGWFVQNSNAIQLTVDNPIIGLSYFIYWDPPPKQSVDKSSGTA